MKGDARIITALNARLVEEYTGKNQYEANLGRVINWQFNKFADYLRERIADEQSHINKLIDLICFWDGALVVGQLNPVNPGMTIPDMLMFDRASEANAIQNYNATLDLCREVGDEITAEVIRGILNDEADHINDIEARQAQIAQCGIGPFLAIQI